MVNFIIIINTVNNITDNKGNMMRQQLAMLHIRIGFIWLLAGMLFGLWMGITENFQFSNAHAHANLVGFLLSVIYGIILNFYPGIAQSKIAIIQLYLYQIGAACLVSGKVLVTVNPEDTALVALGSLVTICATAVFVWMLFSNKSKLPSKASSVPN